MVITQGTRFLIPGSFDQFEGQFGDVALLDLSLCPFAPKRYWIRYKEPRSLVLATRTRRWQFSKHQYRICCRTWIAPSGWSFSLSSVSLLGSRGGWHNTGSQTGSLSFLDLTLELNEFTFTKPLMADSDLNKNTMLL